MTGRKTVSIVNLLVTVFLFLSVLPAAAADTPQTQETPVTASYTVQAGDSLWFIGLRFQTTVEAISEINNLTSTEIYPGQALKIPGDSFNAGKIPQTINYLVQKGDTLFIIGRKFGTGATEIIQASGLQATVIYPGQNITVPLPPQKRYLVRGGDTLYLLAKRFGTTIEALMTVNNLNTTELRIGQEIFVPGGISKGVPDLESPDSESGSQTDGGQWGLIPEGVILYRVQLGENLWSLARRFNTTESAIITTNHLHTDLIQANQPLFIAEGSSGPVTIPYPKATQKEGYGALYDWEYASWILDTHNVAEVKDLVTGKSFKARRLGGSNHADMEPLTADDTTVMQEIFGGGWSWNTRAVLVYADGNVIAASMAGMPHSVQTITDNGFQGHFDLHFLNSRTHNTNSIDPDHQAMVQKAAGN